MPNVSNVPFHFNGREYLAFCLGEPTTSTTLNASYAEDIGEIEKRIEEIEQALKPRTDSFDKQLLNRTINSIQDDGQLGFDASSVMVDVKRQREDFLRRQPEYEELTDLKEYKQDLVSHGQYSFAFDEPYNKAGDIPVGELGVLLLKIELAPEAKKLALEVSTSKSPVASLMDVDANSRAAYVAQVEVLPGYRGKGHVDKLLNAALDHVSDKVSFSYALIEGKNPTGQPMIKAFKRHGFQTIDGLGVNDHDQGYTFTIRSSKQ